MRTSTSIPLDDTSRRDPQLWPKLSDTDWAALHVPRFADLRPHFERCKDALTGVLKEACKKLAPQAIIQVRAKEVPSFAEKILRKRSNYTDASIKLPPDPLMRLTDLCGGRVICQTEAQVRAVCAFIEANFAVDWENSDDASERLHTSEFGYRTINRIVSFKTGAFPEALVPCELCAPVAVPGLNETMPLKMEIQVRTLLAHAWADTAHDHFYKTEVKVPERIKRSFATMAAVLEEADRDFARVIESLDEFHSNYGAHHKRDKVQSEIALLRIVLCQLEQTEQLTAQAVKIARLAMAIGDQQQAIDVLAPFAAQTTHHVVQRTLGQALTELHHDNPTSSGFKQGRTHLEQAAEAEGADAETFCLLGEAALLCHDDQQASEAYHQAITRDSSEPVSLARYLEDEVARHRDHRLVRLAEPMIRSTMSRCRTQIEGCVNLPGAWAALALFHLLVNEPHEALDALAHLMSLCEAQHAGEPPQPCTAARHVFRLREAVRRLHAVKASLSGYDAMERALLLALAVRGHQTDALEALKARASWTQLGEPRHLPPDLSAVIICGGCATDVEAAVKELKPHLLSAFVGLPLEDRPLVLISGGTTAGISRLAGDVAQASAGRIKACGYLPKTVPMAYRVDHDTTRFAWLRESSGGDFTVLDPLQGWTDLVAAGVAPARIKLLAFAPGLIAHAEIALALALGVRVGLIEQPALPPCRQFDDASWLSHVEEGSLIHMPMDAMTLRAFLLTGELPAADTRFEAAAKQVHEAYLKSAKPADLSLAPWDSLPEALKVSNYHQVAYWRNILATEHLGVRPITTDSPAADFDIQAAIGVEKVRRLAEMEHGRWNVERLLRGWRYDVKKDVAKKLSPYLVPWTALTAEIQGYDLDAIRGLSKNLRAAGFEVYQLEKNP